VRVWVVVVLVSLVGLPSAAAAATFTFSVTTSSPVTAPGVTLSGDDQTKTFAIVTQVAYTGSGNTAGWKVTAAATAPTSSSRTLPALQVTAGTFGCVSGCTTSPSPSGITYPITLSTTAQKIYNASANTGRGTYSVTNTYQVTYPASAIAGTYSSTVTLTGSTGP
jgi:hypothetical protein